jgi:DNA-binding HxlR family transcriptional regulator
MVSGPSTAHTDARAEDAVAIVSHAAQHDEPLCCPYYHRAVELIGRRWTGAILEILLQGGPLRFSSIAAAVPDLSDRMLSDRLKELELHQLVERTVYPGPPVRVQYALTIKGRELAPALTELKRWARTWLGGPA